MDRRGFLSAGGAGLLLCTIDGRQIAVRTPDDVKQVDAAMATLRRPRDAARKQPQRDPLDSASFPSPQPQPGGQKREYWIAARPVKWNVAPNGGDQWMGKPAPRPSRFTAFVYQAYSAGFAAPIGPPKMPGPTRVKSPRKAPS